MLVASVSRLVPRKGMDTLVRATAEADRRLGPTGPRLRLVIGGTGGQERELRRLIADLEAPVTLTGRLTDRQVAELYGAADLMAMLCNERWWGLEQEGFGIVFLEAAAAGLPQIAGRSGGAHEAVEDGVTGLVLDDPDDVDAAAGALVRLATDPDQRAKFGEAARRRPSSCSTTAGWRPGSRAPSIRPISGSEGPAGRAAGRQTGRGSPSRLRPPNLAHQ